MGSVRTNTWPTMGPFQNERRHAGPKQITCSHEDQLGLSSSVNFTCGSQDGSCSDHHSSETTRYSTSSRSLVAVKTRYTSSQWLTLVGLAFGNFAIGACVSLQAPFFPKEAERKGASAAEYGFVFGIYQLTMFVGSILFGKMVAYISPSFTLVSGIFVVGVSSILFGTLDRAPSAAFIPLAVSVRVAEGVGSIAAKTSAYVIIGVQFQDTLATTFASMETCLGVGLIVGPTLGGALYQLGGYPAPFMVIGGLLLLDAVVILLVIPKDYGSVGQPGELVRFWWHGSVVLNAVIVFTTFLYIGFQGAALEPHIRQFGLTPMMVGSVFVVSGATYALTAPAWGNIIDRGVDPKYLTIAGCFVLLFSEALIGPASFIPLDTKLWLVILSLFLCGFGCGAKLVSTFVSCLRKTIARGFPNDLSTFGLVSTMYSSSLAVGAFAGPTLGGYLLDIWGFGVCCSLIVAVEVCMLLVTSLSLVYRKVSEERRQLLPEKLDYNSHFEASYSQIF